MTHDYDKILVRVYQGFDGMEEYRISLSEWIKKGPPIRYPAMAPSDPITIDGKKLPESVIPLQYRNTPFVRLLIKWGFIKYPWSNEPDWEFYD
jgi:hypothetical protein